MKRIVYVTIFSLILAFPTYSHALTSIYHLHKERSDIRGILQLSEAGPDARIKYFRSIELKNQQVGEYLIKEFHTQVGVPNFSGVIPAGSSIVFSLWMKKTADFGVIHPLTKLYLNNASGTLLCTASGPSPLTTILFNHTFRCATVTDIAVTSQDRFYLWVGVNMTAGPGANRVKAELDIEGTLNGNYDSRIIVAQPIIADISPKSGNAATVVTITGFSFGNTQGASTVTFSETQADVSSWSNTNIVATVPNLINFINNFSEVIVTVAGEPSNSVPFSNANPVSNLPAGYITTVAGNGNPYGLGSPSGVAVDNSWGFFIALGGQHRITKGTQLSYGADTAAGTGVEGYSGDGSFATNAQLHNPEAVAADSFGNLYIADWFNNRVRKVSPDGMITTVAGTGVAGYSGDGGPAINAQISYPDGIAVDAMGNFYITGDSLVRKVDTNGIITTVAGTGVAGFSGDGGPAINAQLRATQGLAIDGSGNIFINDVYHRVRKVSPDGVISTVAGTGVEGYSGDGGPATSAQLNYPSGVAVDSQGNLYISDTSNHRIRKVSIGGIITTVAGNGIAGYSGDGGPAINAQLCYPYGVAIDIFGNLFIADSYNYRVRKVTPKNPPIINDISPTSGSVGTSVTISGSNFGATQGSSAITFNGILATPTVWSDTSIVTTVPSGATTGLLVVIVGGESSNSITFTVSPKIVSLSPASGPVGTSVTISGSNFGSTQGSSTITFNGILAAPTSWSDTNIVTQVPNGASTGPVVVTVNGMSSNEIIFTVNIPLPPEITSLSPSAGPVNSTITISGVNFGASKGASTVTLNGITLATTSWSDTGITALLPIDAATGPVVVTVNSQSSNSKTYTVITDTLTITYPINSSIINRPDTVVIGRLPSTGNDVGVTVNGQIAMVNGQDFAINGINLSIGENVITATMKDANGNTSTNVTMYSETQGSYVKLSSTIESSLAPMTTQLSLETSLTSPVTETSLTIDGPVPQSITAVTFPYSVTLYIPGIYLTTVTVTTSDGNIYLDKYALNAMDRVNMDALLNGKWTSVINALSSKDLNTALTYMLPTSRPSYQAMFNAVIDQLPSIMATQTEFNLISVTNDAAKYELVTIENGETYSYEVIFGKDENGLWMIEGF